MEKISFNLVMMFMNILTAAVQGGEHPQLEDSLSPKALKLEEEINGPAIVNACRAFLTKYERSVFCMSVEDLRVFFLDYFARCITGYDVPEDKKSDAYAGGLQGFLKMKDKGWTNSEEIMLIVDYYKD